MTAARRVADEDRQTAPNITHRYRCTLPGYHVEHSRTMPGLRIVRCTGCDAVALTKEGTR